MLPRQQIFAVLAAVGLILLIAELIRRRRLREEYALLWLGVGGGVLVLALWYGLLERLTRLIGAVAPTTTLFLFAFLFLLVMAMHFSIKLSKMAGQVKDLTQEIAILRAELEKAGRSAGPQTKEEKSCPPS